MTIIDIVVESCGDQHDVVLKANGREVARLGCPNRHSAYVMARLLTIAARTKLKAA